MVSPAQIHRIKLGVCNCYIVKQKNSMLIDAGPPKQERKFIRKTVQLGIDPEEISLIVATHGHLDHIGSLFGIKTVTGGEVMSHRLEREILEKAALMIPEAVTPWAKFLRFLLKLSQQNVSFEPTPVETVVDDEFSLSGYGIDGKILHTPGHSVGSISILLDTGDAFVGDLLMNGFPMRRGPGAPIFADDPEAVEKSVQLLLKNGAKTFYPGHGDPFGAHDLLNED
ncbi:MAG TPA: MBL fold metallo-hydrolase [Spirochaetota bacterium]|nr:MBL fold metallo-hydrolase [Spirochaetota bacterium]